MYVAQKRRDHAAGQLLTHNLPLCCTKIVHTND